MPFVMGRAVPVVVPVMLISLLTGRAVVAQLDGGPPLFSQAAGKGLVLIHYWNFDTIPNDVDFSKTGKELLDAASRHYGAFLSYSGGRWESENYGVDWAEADRVTGPYRDTSVAGGPRLLRSVPGCVVGPGHNSIVAGPDGSDYVAYHAWDGAMTARRMYLERLEWTADGPRVARRQEVERAGA